MAEYVHSHTQLKKSKILHIRTYTQSIWRFPIMEEFICDEGGYFCCYFPVNTRCN